ncbi:hypothetical protein P167DRAFT_269972 [Morchella conica CCBAS932]|uniref:Uncharacterized protein n=1 Tax=Morchella conica CCBAS932 TaxID=1392247 RepID=A0A3N4KI68_9PEZI|nr:hypothetical protein P167DRAFT_269972 [Morchella conica CCBAS932]
MWLFSVAAAVGVSRRRGLCVLFSALPACRCIRCTSQRRRRMAALWRRCRASRWPTSAAASRGRRRSFRRRSWRWERRARSRYRCLRLRARASGRTLCARSRRRSARTSRRSACMRLRPSLGAGMCFWRGGMMAFHGLQSRVFFVPFLLLFTSPYSSPACIINRGNNNNNNNE